MIRGLRGEGLLPEGVIFFSFDAGSGELEWFLVGTMAGLEFGVKSLVGFSIFDIIWGYVRVTSWSEKSLDGKRESRFIGEWK